MEGGAPSDWLAAAASGHTRRENNGATGTAPRRKSSNDHGGAWMTAGKLGLSVGGSDHEDDNNIRKTKVRSVGTKAAVARATAGTNVAGGVPPVTSTGPGGWLAAAAASGRLDVLGSDDVNNDGEAGSGMDDLRPKGVTIETQTEENIGQAIEESTKPRLPPWAKPWTPPSAAAAAATGSVEEAAIAKGAVHDGRKQDDAKPGSSPSPTAAGIGLVEGTTQGRTLTSK